MVTIGITKVRDTGEYRVFWRDGRRDDEGKAGYTDDALDAVGSMYATYRYAKAQGIPIQISDARYTRSLVEKFDASQGGLVEMSDVDVEHWHRTGDPFGYHGEA